MRFRLKAELPAERGRFNARTVHRRFTDFMQKSNTKPANVEIFDVRLLDIWSPVVIQPHIFKIFTYMGIILYEYLVKTCSKYASDFCRVTF